MAIHGATRMFSKDSSVSLLDPDKLISSPVFKQAVNREVLFFVDQQLSQIRCSLTTEQQK